MVILSNQLPMARNRRMVLLTKAKEGLAHVRSQIRKVISLLIQASQEVLIQNRHRVKVLSLVQRASLQVNQKASLRKETVVSRQVRAAIVSQARKLAHHLRPRSSHQQSKLRRSKLRRSNRSLAVLTIQAQTQANQNQQAGIRNRREDPTPGSLKMEIQKASRVNLDQAKVRRRVVTARLNREIPARVKVQIQSRITVPTTTQVKMVVSEEVQMVTIATMRPTNRRSQISRTWTTPRKLPTSRWTSLKIKSSTLIPNCWSK